MKKLFFVVVALLGLSTVQAQHQIKSFFDDMGLVRIETQELAESADTLVTVFHRADDIVWSRVVYRVIDMRFKQNYQLYTPLSNDPVYNSLIKVMLMAVADSMPVSAKDDNGDLRPFFNADTKRVGADVFSLLDVYNLTDFDADEETRAFERILRLDSTQNVEFYAGAFPRFAKNQLKYMIQEIVFFDKHYSRMYSKILAIAPMHADNIQSDNATVMDALYQQILFWIPFDSFRPYMAQQYIMPNGNDTKRVTFDDFFAQRLYSSYIVGTNNIYNRLIPEYATTPEEIKKEQSRIEWELLSAEQDLWEY
jgi:gliding motility associated protien GldN